MALKDFFNNLYYGKPGQADFTEKDLPANRIQLFKEVLKVRRGSMMGLNLLYLIIWIPAGIWTAINFLRLSMISPEETASLLLTYLLILFPFIAITGPFTAGISYVVRNWARDEHSFPFSDFVKGLKLNWKQSLLMSSISGAIPLLLFMGIRFYSGMASTSIVFYFPIGILTFAALLWVLACQILPTMMVTYKLSFGALVKNSVLITLATLPRSIGIKLVTLALPILAFLCALFIPSVMLWLGAIILYAYIVFMLSFNKLIQASYSNYVCEKYLNAKIEGAEVGIGLRKADA